ncbi:RDD family protein [Burkholderiaceae bacterium UC74_6]
MEQQSQQQPAASATSAEAAGVEYVGFWARVGAALIDTIAIGILLAILARILGLGVQDFSGDLQALMDRRTPLSEHLFNHVLPAAIVIVCWLRFAATPGKRVIGAEVVDAQTFQRLKPAQALLRYVCYYVSTIPFCLGLIWVAIDARKQGWHDKIAGTVVIRKR